MVKKISFLIVILCITLLYSCNQNTSKTDNRDESTIGSVENEVVLQVEFLNEEGKEKLGDSLSAILLGEGFKWSEGPLWIEEKEVLLFSDIPNNKVFKWTESEGMTEYLQFLPSLNWIEYSDKSSKLMSCSGYFLYSS